MQLLPPVSTGQPLLDVVHHTDLLTLCAALPDQSIDMILADLPYGTTACVWDVIIPFAPMWAAFKRIVKPRGAIVLTASQPFTSVLVCSNLEMFRYEWVWDKKGPSGFLNAKLGPLKSHESVIVFGSSDCKYIPQMEVLVSSDARVRVNGRKSTSVNRVYGEYQSIRQPETYQRYPKSILEFSKSNGDPEFGLHPTQKPVALFEYLIRTYTQPGDVVLDPCCGSGTTAIAARNAARRWICGDSSAEYVQVAKNRLAAPHTLLLPGIEMAEKSAQTS
jgi:site-specific DNA-methyltransferase (adenine-specific)